MSKSAIFNKERLMKFIETAKIKDFDKDAVYLGGMQTLAQYRSLIALSEQTENLRLAETAFC